MSKASAYCQFSARMKLTSVPTEWDNLLISRLMHLYRLCGVVEIKFNNLRFVNAKLS